MASRLISFRLSDEAIEALSAFTLPNESINLVAQRVLLDALGLSTVDNSVDKSISIVDSLVDRVVDSELFSDRLQEKLEFVVNGLNGKLQEYEQKLESLEEKLTKPASKASTRKPRKPKEQDDTIQALENSDSFATTI